MQSFAEKGTIVIAVDKNSAELDRLRKTLAKKKARIPVGAGVRSIDIVSRLFPRLTERIIYAKIVAEARR